MQSTENAVEMMTGECLFTQDLSAKRIDHLRLPSISVLAKSEPFTARVRLPRAKVSFQNFQFHFRISRIRALIDPICRVLNYITGLFLKRRSLSYKSQSNILISIEYLEWSRSQINQIGWHKRIMFILSYKFFGSDKGRKCN